MQPSSNQIDLLQKMIDALEECSDPKKRSEEATKNICNALRLIPFFQQNIQSLNNQDQNELIKEFSQYIQLEKYLPGQIIFKAGEKGDKFYIILKGAVDIFKPKDSEQIDDLTLREITHQISYENLVAKEEEDAMPSPKKVSSQYRKMSIHRKNSIFHFPLEQILQKDDEETIFQDLHFKLVTIRTGGSFGELALTFNKPRFATARINIEDSFQIKIRKLKKNRLSLDEIASLPITYIATLNKESYNKINSFQKEQMNMKVQALQQVFPKVPTNTLMRIGYNLVQSNYTKNHVLYKQGDVTDSFYIIFDGEVQLLKQIEKNQIIKNIPNPLLSRQQKNRLIQKPISLLGKGSILGVQEVFDKVGRQYTAICMSYKTVLYKCFTVNFKDLLSDRSKLNEMIDFEQEFLKQQQVIFKKEQEKLIQNKKLNYRCILESEKTISNKQYSRTIHGNEISFNQQGQDKISMMVRRNIKLKKNNKKFSFNINFSNPFFKEQNNPVQIRKIKRDFEKAKNREEYNKNFSIQNFFQKAPLSSRLSKLELESERVLSKDYQQDSPFYSFKVMADDISRPYTSQKMCPTININMTHKKQMKSLTERSERK